MRSHARPSPASIRFQFAPGQHAADVAQIDKRPSPFAGRLGRLVEAFEATDDFKPEKAFKTRLKWRDRNGGEQSKLLLTSPDAVIATVLRGEVPAAAAGKVNSRRPSANRTQRRKAQKAASVQP